MIERRKRNEQTGRGWWGAVACAGACVVAATMIAPVANAASPYTIASYPVDATASDAVAAKSQGLAEAEKGAFRYLMKRLVSVTAYRRLPELNQPAVDDLVESVSVRSEQTSSTEYIATLDFGFRVNGVRQLLDRAGLPYLDRQAPLLTVIPVYSAPETGPAHGAVSLLEGQRAWRQAWSGLDLQHSLTPITLAVAGPSSTNEGFLKLAAGDRSKLGVVQAESSSDKLLVAIASPSPDGSKLVVTLVGEDWTGSLELRRSYTLYYQDFAYTSEFAAVAALGVLEGRWKLGQGLNGSEVSASGNPGWAATSGDPGAAPETVRLTAVFTSLQQWQQMRNRLGQIAGPQNLQVGALSARGAEVSVAYPGGAGALQQRLAAEGLQLGDAGGHLVLQAAN